MDPPDPRNAATATEAEGGSCTRFAVLSIRFSVAVGLIRHFVAAANENTMRERGARERGQKRPRYYGGHVGKHA